MLNGKDVLFKGAGDFASGAIRRLNLAGARVVATELEKPLNVRREVSFSEAVWRGSMTVEGVKAELSDFSGIDAVLSRGNVAIVIDPKCSILRSRKFDIVVDGIMAKRNTGTGISDAQVVIALGPGFYAGRDCHAVIETLAGHDLGRVIYEGEAAANTGIPGPPESYLGPCSMSADAGDGTGKGMVLRAPASGIFTGTKNIGQIVDKGDVLGNVDGIYLKAEIKGVLRGLIHDGVAVEKGLKLGDIDPSCEVKRAFTISEKSNAIAGGVLEACLHLSGKTGDRDRPP
jgi:xanthine dehydrogenase accessory factor